MRKPRKLEAGSVYHVTNRINNASMALESDEIKHLFYAVLRRAKMKYGFQILQLCIMGNHVHLLIKPKGMDPYELSRICQWIFSTFARVYNNVHRTSGHVWGDRFHSRIIKNTKHLKNVCFYINENPSRAKIVNNPLEYKFSTVAIVKNRIRWNRDWDVFEDLPKSWKKIILSMIHYYSQAEKKHRFPVLLHEKNQIIDITKYYSFYSNQQKWCKNGASNIEAKNKMGKDFNNFMNQMAQENLKFYRKTSTGIWQEYGNI